jgi:D-glycero-D-manno-heptose 1,7-bisphosphate phosphatase
VSATIDHVVRVRITPRPDRVVEVRSLDLDRLVAYHLDEGPVYDGALDLVKAAIADAGTDVGISVEIRSEAPPGSGLGGSSALVTAVVAGLAMLGDRQMDAGTLARAAYRIEREELAISGGWQDQYAAAFGGCNLIEFSRSGVGVEPVADATTMDRLRCRVAVGVLNFLGGAPPQRGDRSIVDRHAPRGSRGDAARHEAPHEMAYAVRDVIERADLPGLGALLHEAFIAKKQMNPHIAEHTPIEAMLAAAREAAYGGKVCGAGAAAICCWPRRRIGTTRSIGARALDAQFAPSVHARRGAAPLRGGESDPAPVTRRFALVDRDGTINEERHHLRDPDDLALIPGAADALIRLRDDLGLGIVVITNQAEVGRGNLSIPELDRIHARLRSLLGVAGASVDAIEVCPHRPEDGCACRKPAPGMALAAAERFGFALEETFVIGDHASDMGLGRAIGATTVFVRTGHGLEEEPTASPLADHRADDLAGAVAIIAGLVEPGGMGGSDGPA